MVRPSTIGAFAVLALLLGPGFGRAQLKTVLEVRSLTTAEAESSLPVDVRGTVVFVDGPATVFFQDGTAGTFFRLDGREAPRPGDEIRVTGMTIPGLYVPGIDKSEFEILGHPGLPEAPRIGFDDLRSGRFHYQRVTVEGIVRTVAADGEKAGVARVAIGSRVVEVRVEAPPPEDGALVDSRVRVTGLVAGELNPRRQLVEPYLRCRGWEEIEVLEPGRSRGAIPSVSPDQLLNFAVGGQDLHRVKVSGVVLASFSDGEIYLRSGEVGIGAVRTRSDTEIRSGDFVELIGFPEMDRYSARLVDAEVFDHLLGEGPAEPVEMPVEELLDGMNDSNLVAVEGEVVGLYPREAGGGMDLHEGSQTIRVDLPAWPQSLLPGTRVRVAGIAVVETTRRSSAYRSAPDRVLVRMRSLDDLAVLRKPSWWTPRRLAIGLIVFSVASVFAGLWIALLQRQVARQTTALRHRIEHEAALEERQRLAREFHDTLEQELAGLSLRLGAAASRGGDEKLHGLLEGSRSLVSRIQIETRNLVSDLRQDPDEATDFGGALAELSERCGSGAGPEIHLRYTAEGIPPLPSRTVHHLRMIARESVANALKHADARRIELSAGAEDGNLVMRIRDDGRGFDVGSETSGKSGHFGCMGMRERCRRIGAVVAWRSLPGEGCEVVVTLPLAQDGKEER